MFLQNKWFIEQLIPDVDNASGLSMYVVSTSSLYTTTAEKSK